MKDSLDEQWGNNDGVLNTLYKSSGTISGLSFGSTQIFTHLSLISLHIVQAESYTYFCFCSQPQEVTEGKKLHGAPEQQPLKLGHLWLLDERTSVSQTMEFILCHWSMNGFKSNELCISDKISFSLAAEIFKAFTFEEEFVQLIKM